MVSLFAGLSKRTSLFLVVAAALLTADGVRAASANANVGQQVTLSVAAQGSAPFTYQWYKNGAAVSGGTSGSYTIASATINDTATYTAVVRNSSGSTVSDQASLVVNAVVVAPPPPPPSPVPTTISDSGFESVRVGINDYWAFKYNPSIPNWNFAGASGITGNNSGFTSGNPASPEGSQVAFVQVQGSATTRVNLAAGRYIVSAMVANRANSGWAQTVLVYVDGAQVGRFAAGATYVQAATSAFDVGDGAHDISFAGQATNDATLFLDQVKVTAVSSGSILSSGGFEAPNAGSDDYWAFRYNPPVQPGIQDWTFEGASGVTGNNTGFTVGNPNAPEGRQVAFIQIDNSVMSQTIFLPATRGYQLSVTAAQRAWNNQAEQIVQIYLDNVYINTIVPHSGNYQTYNIPFTANAGSHVLKFRGIVGVDATAFLDQISIR